MHLFKQCPDRHPSDISASAEKPQGKGCNRILTAEQEIQIDFYLIWVFVLVYITKFHSHTCECTLPGGKTSTLHNFNDKTNDKTPCLMAWYYRASPSQLGRAFSKKTKKTGNVCGFINKQHCTDNTVISEIKNGKVRND